MATFVYEGPSEQLYLCWGRRTAALHRNVPTELDGEAAVHAAGHPQVRQVEVGEEPDTDPSAAEPDTDPSAAEVRAWAREVGIEVPARGALRPELYEQYKAANGG